jgi:hypothetical protein
MTVGAILTLLSKQDIVQFKPISCDRPVYEARMKVLAREKQSCLDFLSGIQDLGDVLKNKMPIYAAAAGAVDSEYQLQLYQCLRRLYVVVQYENVLLRGMEHAIQYVELDE